MRCSLSVFLVCLFIASCSPNGNNSNAQTTNSKQVSAIDQGKIGNDYVNELRFGEEIQTNQDIDGGRLVKANQTQGNNGRTNYYAYVKDGEEDIMIYPAYDFRVDAYTNMIGQISVMSENYQDSKGVHVGSSVSEYLAAYPKAYAYLNLAKEELIFSDQGYGPQYIVDMSGLQEEEQTNIGKIPTSQVKSSAKIKEIRIVRSRIANEDYKIDYDMEGKNIFDDYMKSVVGSFFLDAPSENYYKIHFLQGEYFISECFEDECYNKGKIKAAVLQANGMVDFKVENISGEMVPSWVLKPLANGNTELLVHDYDGENDVWNDRVFLQLKDN